MELSHRIFRQKWQVSTSSEKQAFAIRKELRQEWDGRLLPIFDKAFSEYASNDEIVHIPKIEINLKVSYGKELWDEIADGLYQQLSELLRSENPNIAEGSGNNPEPTAITLKQHRFELLLYYLENGVLPGYSAFQRDDMVAVLPEAIQENRQQLLEYIRRNRVLQPFLFRLIQFLQVEEIVTLTEVVGRGLPQVAKEELNLLLQGLLIPELSHFNLHSSKMLVAAFLHAANCHDNPTTLPDWKEEAARLLSKEGLFYFERFFSYLHKKSRLSPSSVHWKNHFSGPSEYLVVNRQNVVSQFPGKEIVAGFWAGNESDAISNRENIFGKGLSSEKAGASQNSSTEFLLAAPFENDQGKSGISVHHAGLMILHPFFGRLFTISGIISEGDKQIPVRNLSKAAALLHFVATGREELFEFELGFIKLLLGMEPSDPLAVSKGLLNQKQMEEAESMLQAVVSHWHSIGKTSNDGLRATFIQRNGMLYPFENGWKVILESAAFDMLLNTIPWSYSIIKLPWMDKPIYTECQKN
ncbi:MAG: contractile injection system tape measure protein [Bacteroidia bacterium]|nr:contractile injection system tape measure protein [Bacteroidia bacterium]